MNLKKNDKIILIAGVAILIIAGIGIAMYTSPNSDELDIGDTEPDYYSYTYNWIKNPADIMIDDSIYVEKSSAYNGDITVNSPSGSVITDVIIEIIWEDDYTHGLLRTRGEDTLSITITNENGGSKTDSKTGGENLTFQFNSINDMPTPDSILAEDKIDAMNILDGMISGENSVYFNIEAIVETGERLFRPLRFIRDKGNDFQIRVKYNYYIYELEDPIDDFEDDDNITTGNDSEFNIGLGDFYKNLCYGRSMI